jgi:hypothetical protein
VHDLGVFKALGMTPRQTIAMVMCWVAGTGLVAGPIAVPAGVALHRYVLPVMASSANLGLPASFLNVYHGWELVALGLAGVTIAVAGALLPAGWAAGSARSPRCGPNKGVGGGWPGRGPGRPPAPAVSWWQGRPVARTPTRSSVRCGNWQEGLRPKGSARTALLPVNDQACRVTLPPAAGGMRWKGGDSGQVLADSHPAGWQAARPGGRGRRISGSATDGFRARRSRIGGLRAR